MQPPLLVHLLLLIATVSASPLHPKQLKSLQSLNIPTNKDPCNNITHSSITITCDSSSPYRHITSLSFTNCSSTLTLTSKTLKPLSKSLFSLSFNECPTLIPPHHLPISLHSFSADYSFLDNHQGQQLSGTYLARLIKLKTLKISSIPISTSNHLYVILGNMHKLKSLTISNSNLTGVIPKSFHSNLTHIDLSYNSLKGSIRNSITHLRHLKFLDLSHNSLSGQIPNKIENLIWLNTLSLASNNLSGTIPNSISSISQLTYVDLSKNQLNGTVPLFFFKMKNLKHLNLAENSFRGVLPFNESFIRNLEVFKIGGNSELCYNKSVLSSKLELGIAPCDRHGFPSWSTSQKKGPTLSGENDYGDYNGEGGNWKKMENEEEEEDNGTNKALFGIGIALCSLVFLIIFLIYLAKRWRCIQKPNRGLN